MPLRPTGATFGSWTSNRVEKLRIDTTFNAQLISPKRVFQKKRLTKNLVKTFEIYEAS